MSLKRTHVTIYTDGGCEPNPGVGGWATVLIFDDHEKRLSGGEVSSTNNKMELTAVIQALDSLEQPYAIDLHTDSEYVKKGITEWIRNWIRKNWRDVKNVELWQELYKATKRHEIRWHWVKGHAGDKYNELCDQLAYAEIQKLQSKQVVSISPDTDYSIYTHVDCGGDNYGECGWGTVITDKGQQQEFSGSNARSSGQRMALVAAIFALKFLRQPAKVTFFSDSGYLITGMSQWIQNWLKNKWRNYEGEPVKNRELWEELYELTQKHEVQWIPVKKNVPPEIWNQVCELAAKARAEKDKTG